MGILDQFDNPQEQKELENKLKGNRKAADTKKASGRDLQVNNVAKEETIGKKINKEKKIKLSLQDQPAAQTPVTLFIEKCLSDYQKGKKTKRLVGVQDDLFKLIFPLKIYNVSVSEFVNLAIQYTMKSEDYPKILKTLKKVK